MALMLPNIPEFVYSYFGALKIGAAVVPLNTSSTPFELTYLLNNSDSKVLITQTSQMKKYQDAKDKLLSCHKIISIDSLNENGELLAGTDYDDSSPVEINPEDPAELIYTAGLTGKSMGAVLTHHNLCSAAQYDSAYFSKNAGRYRSLSDSPFSLFRGHREHAERHSSRLFHSHDGSINHG